MTNSSFMSATAPAAAAVTPVYDLLGGHHAAAAAAFLSDSGAGNLNLNNATNGAGGGVGVGGGFADYSNSTPRGAYGTATALRDGAVVAVAGGGGGGAGAELDGGDGSGELGASCHDWQDAQHTLFQLANLCMAVSFLTPPSFRFHVLFLRCLLLLAFLLFVLWAGLFICMPDVLGWNLVFFLLNGSHIGWLLYRHLPARLPVTLAPFYAKVFKPVMVTQEEFLELCKIGSMHDLGKGSLYAMEGLTHCGQKVSVLIKGRLKVTYQRLFLHHVENNQFVDAAEYDSWSFQQIACDKYQVTISASTDSLLLTWEYQALQAYLATRPFMRTALHYLTGKDVSTHLYAIQEQLMQAPDYMATLASRQSSMVNVRSCLAAHDSSASLCRMADFTGYRPLTEFESSSSTTQPTSPNTVETCV